jgi:hypothetical protein
MLINLSKRFNLTAEYREREVLKQWTSLRDKGFIRGMSIENWLVQWEKAYADGVQLDLPEIKGRRALRDFLASASGHSPGFTNYWQNRLMDGGVEVLDFYELVSKLREYLAENTVRQQTPMHGTFGVSMQGKGPDGQSVCLCGEDHRFSQCPYLIRQKRAVGWKPDLEIEKKVKGKLERSESLRLLIEDLQAYAIRQANKGLPSEL